MEDKHDVGKIALDTLERKMEGLELKYPEHQELQRVLAEGSFQVLYGQHFANDTTSPKLREIVLSSIDTTFCNKSLCNQHQSPNFTYFAPNFWGICSVLGSFGCDPICKTTIRTGQDVQPELLVLKMSRTWHGFMGMIQSTTILYYYT